MPGPVFDKVNEFFRTAKQASGFFIHQFAQRAHEINIFPFTITSDIVGLSRTSFMINQIDRLSMVFNIKPISDVRALTIDRKWYSFADIMNHQRNKFFRKLIRPVIVAAVADDNRKPIGSMISSHEMITRCFGSRIGTPGRVRCFFSKISGVT